MQNLLDEIQSAKNFINIRDGLHPHLIHGLVTSIIKQINSLQTLGPQDATVLSEALSDAPYGEAGTASVNAAIDAALQKTLSTPQPSPDEPKQFLKNWWLTCTPTDWNTLRSNVPWSAKLTCLVERANSLGCTHPDEQCCKWMLALLLCACYSELPTPKERYNKLQELKNCVATERKVYPYEHLTTYPQKITDLPSHMWDYAYSAEGPLELDFPGVNLVADRIPLRKNSKLLKDHPSADTAARAAVSNSQIEIAGVPDLPTPALKNADQHVPANKAPPFSQDIVLSDPTAKAVADKVDLQAGQDQAAGHESALDPFSAEALKIAALKALQMRNTKKKQKAAETAKGKKAAAAASAGKKAAEARKKEEARKKAAAAAAAERRKQERRRKEEEAEQNNKKMRGLKI